MASQLDKYGNNVGITWCHYTGNLWWGCTAVHAGCDHCYAETLSNRYGKSVWGNDNPRQAMKKVWSDFLKWQAVAADAGEIHRVFVGSMMDIFEKSMPCIDTKGQPIEGGTGPIRDRFFKEIVPACPNLMFLLLTKRPSNINKMIPAKWHTDPPKNVMFGTSPVDQKTFETLVPQLRRVNGRRFLSVEPHLGNILMEPDYLDGIDWLIQGGESGAKRRFFNIAWGYSIKYNCARLGVPYFFKQIDKVQSIPEDLMIRQFPICHEPSIVLS